MESEDVLNKIFGTISDIIAEEEFSNGQTDFYIKNCKVFNEDEENKHEYMKIFEEYVYIIDQAIDSKLAEQYDQENIDHFYKTFKEKFENYKEINYDTVEILFNAVDFESFKKTMLRFKDGVTVEKEADRDPSKANLGEASEEKFYRIVAENHDPKYKWRKTLEMKAGKDYSG